MEHLEHIAEVLLQSPIVQTWLNRLDDYRNMAQVYSNIVSEHEKYRDSGFTTLEKMDREKMFEYMKKQMAG